MIASVLACSAPANADDSPAFTAGVVMNEMDQSERFPFVAGIVEGLAYGRYVRDGQQIDGMSCIYDWFYETDGRIMQVYQAFEAYPDYPPGAVVSAMIQQVCGE